MMFSRSYYENTKVVATKTWGTWNVCRSEGNSTEELQGESQALKFVLNISH